MGCLIEQYIASVEFLDNLNLFYTDKILDDLLSDQNLLKILKIGLGIGNPNFLSVCEITLKVLKRNNE